MSALDGPTKALLCMPCVLALAQHFPDDAASLDGFECACAECGDSCCITSGMAGDAYDFAVLQECVRAVCDDREELGPHGELVTIISDEARRALVDAFGRLLRAFAAAETAHRAEFAVLENPLYCKQLMAIRMQVRLVAYPSPKPRDYNRTSEFERDVEA